MNKAIATTVNDPSAKMRGLSIGIFPGFGGRWRAPSARKISSGLAAIARVRDLCGEIPEIGSFGPYR